MANFDPLTQIITTDSSWMDNTGWSDNLGWPVNNNQEQNNENFNGYLYVEDNKQDKMIKVMKLLSACIRHISNKAYIPYPNELEEAEKLLQELETNYFSFYPNWYQPEEIKEEKREEKIVLDEDLFDI